MAMRPKFEPTAHDLDPKFRLTKFTGLHGGGCKVPSNVLNKLLEELGGTNVLQDEQFFSGMILPRLGIGLDCCVIPLRFSGLSLVQTTDFFYPLVDDPYMMGKIACCNVLSDLYAMGVTECDNMLMLLGVSSKFTEKARDVVIPLMMRGFKDCAEEAGTSITGGQTVLNPWCLIGGVATAVCQPNEIIMPNKAVPGDVLVLTKPLGTQVCCNAHQWLEQKGEKWNRIKLIVTEEEVEKAYQDAMFNMARLNKNAAQLMHAFNSHGATDVTGFGILGHAQNLAKQQENEVTFIIHNLPILNKMSSIAKACGNMFGLLEGTSAETSGGLLICLPREQAAKYCAEIKKMERKQAWIIGIVETGDRTAKIIDKPRVIEVETLEDGTVQSVPPVAAPRRTMPPTRPTTVHHQTKPVSNANAPSAVTVPSQTAIPVLPVTQQTVTGQVYEANATGDVTTVAGVSTVTLHGSTDVQQIIVQDPNHYQQHQELQQTQYGNHQQ